MVLKYVAASKPPLAVMAGSMDQEVENIAPTCDGQNARSRNRTGADTKFTYAVTYAFYI